MQHELLPVRRFIALGISPLAQAGMRRVCTVTMPDDLWEPHHLTGTDCLIDGTPYHIHGVQAFCINRSPAMPYRLTVGLVVEPMTQK